MTTYQVHFRTDAEFASQDFEADTPQQALGMAQKLYADDPSELWFEPYEGMPVYEIAVCDPDGDEVAVWLDDDMRFRLASRDLLDAAKKVVARWEQGDLAEAVRDLDAVIGAAKGGAA